MDLKERILELGKSFPAPFMVQNDGSLSCEFTVAERKAFLSKTTLKYRARLRIDAPNKAVNFFESLKESGSGLSSGELDMAPGFGYTKEVTRIKGKEREGNIAELSSLFGRKYKYSFDFGRIRESIRQEAERFGYRLNIVLLEKNV